MSDDAVRTLMRRDVEQLGSQRALARKLGLSVAYISDVLRGRRDIGPSLAQHYGYRIERRIVRALTKEMP